MIVWEWARLRGGRKLGRERNRLPTRSPIWDSIPDSRITPWVKGRGSTPEPPRHPGSWFLASLLPYIFWLEHLVYHHSEWLFKDMNFVPLCYRKSWCFWWRSLVLSSLCCIWSLFFPPLEESLLKFLTGLVKWSWTPLYFACLRKSLSLLSSWMAPLLKQEFIQIGLQWKKFKNIK